MNQTTISTRKRRSTKERKPRGSLAKQLRRIAKQAAFRAPSPSLPCDTDTMPLKIAHVLGPYRNGQKWRLVVFEEGGRKAIIANTLAEAEQMKASMERLFTDRSLLRVGAAVDEYLGEKERDGVAPVTVGTLRYKLRQFLPLDETLGAITPQRAAKMYADETARTGRFGSVISAATHRGLLRSIKAFFRWTIDRGYLRANPFDGVRPVGKVNAGKKQLRLDEARRLNELLIARTESGDEGALAVLVQIVMGMRSSEVLRLQVRDVDNDGAELWVDGTKTKNARRPLSVESKPLQRLLLAHCAGRQPDELLFGAGRSRPYFSDYLWHRVRKYCAMAGVPVVCPHSLRGLHSSLAMERGASSRFVADALGHGSDAVTKRHYIDPASARQASIKRVTAALTRPTTPAAPAAPAADLAATLQAIPPEQLQALLTPAQLQALLAPTASRR